ncbi:VOC family protein [Pseudonocardia sp. KRD291]|uniref:VOC family protein n=1 Tax=Pseudonocardia sp. KRD291 TaxID=2792007 RepID=UPI001C4A5CBC|nr:VOC family protein [Pseudonocardia sp. KRD291]MBW0102805.1 VOC family protein [Pseudonocardia sp. KRD291]
MTQTAPPPSGTGRPPIRLHHNAFVTKDQERTRAFYEDVIGMPLVATWTEVDELSDPELTPSPFRHIALATDQANQDAIRTRIADAGYVEPQTFVLDHGYCVSLYITDPNGLLLEFTVDDPDADAINEVRRAQARKDLERWLGGDHSSNNTYRD